MSTKVFAPRASDEGGFGLIDTLVAMMVLAIILVFSVPAILVAQGTIRRADTTDVLRSSAQAALEEARALDFDDVGIVGGTPSGILTESRTVVVDGVRVQLTSDVGWEGIISGLAVVDSDGDGNAEPGDGVAGFANTGVDYKSITITASLENDPSQTYRLSSIIAPGDLDTALSNAILVEVVRDEPTGSSSPAGDYPTTYLIDPSASWAVTEDPGEESQSFLELDNPDQTFDIRLGFLSSDLDDGTWRLADNYAVTGGSTFLGEAVVVVFKMISLDLTIHDSDGAAISDATIVVSSSDMDDVTLAPADMTAPGQFLVTEDALARPLKWGNYSVSVTAPGYSPATFNFDAPSGYPTTLRHDETLVLADLPASLTNLDITVEDSFGVPLGGAAIEVVSPSLGTLNVTADVNGEASVEVTDGETNAITVTSHLGFEPANQNHVASGSSSSTTVTMAAPSGTKTVHPYVRRSQYVGDYTHVMVRAVGAPWDDAVRVDLDDLGQGAIVLDPADGSRFEFVSYCGADEERTRRRDYANFDDGDFYTIDSKDGCP